MAVNQKDKDLAKELLEAFEAADAVYGTRFDQEGESFDRLLEFIEKRLAQHRKESVKNAKK